MIRRRPWTSAVARVGCHSARHSAPLERSPDEPLPCKCGSGAAVKPPAQVAGAPTRPKLTAVARTVWHVRGRLSYLLVAAPPGGCGGATNSPHLPSAFLSTCRQTDRAEARGRPSTPPQPPMPRSARGCPCGTPSGRSAGWHRCHHPGDLPARRGYAHFVPKAVVPGQAELSCVSECPLTSGFMQSDSCPSWAVLRVRSEFAPAKQPQRGGVWNPGDSAARRLYL